VLIQIKRQVNTSPLFEISQGWGPGYAQAIGHGPGVVVGPGNDNSNVFAQQFSAQSNQQFKVTSRASSVGTPKASGRFQINWTNSGKFISSSIQIFEVTTQEKIFEFYVTAPARTTNGVLYVVAGGPEDVVRYTEMRLQEIYPINGFETFSKDNELRKKPPAIEATPAKNPKWGTPSYDSDYLRVWFRNTDFLQDKEFMKAYRAGINSGHRIGGATLSSQDIHIEWRILVCCWAAWHAKHLSGDFVECGTNTGIMSLAICNYIKFNDTRKNFYLFDTFCGIPDEQVLPEERAMGLHLQNSDYEECFETVKRNFNPYPSVHLVRGKVPDVLPSQPIDKVCYLMLDMNISVPEKAALEYFWEKLVPGAIVLFDDYGWSGYIAQKSAHDAFAASRGTKILNLPTGQGMLIKP